MGGEREREREDVLIEASSPPVRAQVYLLGVLHNPASAVVLRGFVLLSFRSHEPSGAVRQSDVCTRGL